MAGVRAAVVTGTGKCFAAGADLAEVGALQAGEALRFSELGQSLMRKIERQAKPILAVIRGYCLGGGLDLALACQRSEEHTSELQSRPHLVCRLLLEKKKRSGTRGLSTCTIHHMHLA